MFISNSVIFLLFEIATPNGNIVLMGNSNSFYELSVRAGSAGTLTTAILVTTVT